MNSDINFSHTDWKTFSIRNDFKRNFLEDAEILKFCSIFNSTCSPDTSLCNNLEQCNPAVETNSFSDNKLFIAEIFVSHTYKKRTKTSLPKTQHQQEKLAIIHTAFCNPHSVKQMSECLAKLFYHCFYNAYVKSKTHVTKRRLETPSYTPSHFVHIENKSRTLCKTNKRSEKNKNLQLELTLSLNKDEQDLIDCFASLHKQRCIQIVAQLKLGTNFLLPPKKIYIKVKI